MYFGFFNKLLFCYFKNSRVFKFKIKIGFRENTVEVNNSVFSCLIEVTDEMGWERFEISIERAGRVDCTALVALI